MPLPPAGMLPGGDFERQLYQIAAASGPGRRLTVTAILTMSSRKAALKISLFSAECEKPPLPNRLVCVNR